MTETRCKVKKADQSADRKKPAHRQREGRREER